MIIEIKILYIKIKQLKQNKDKKRILKINSINKQQTSTL